MRAPQNRSILLQAPELLLLVPLQVKLPFLLLLPSAYSKNFDIRSEARISKFFGLLPLPDHKHLQHLTAENTTYNTSQENYPADCFPDKKR